MIILGVDPSSTCTGYGLVEKHKYKVGHIAYGCIKPKGSFEDRLVAMYDGLEEIIDRYGPDVGAIETTFYGKDASAAAKLNQARGALIVSMVKAGLPVSHYTPTSIKKSATGTGKATKEQVQFMVSKVLGLKSPPKPLDASDALAIALCHARRG